MIRLVLIVAILSACASVRFGMPTEEVIEGNPESYPAFERAARDCSFTAFRLVSNGQADAHYLVRFSYPLLESDRCVVRWLDDNAELGLYRSAH